MDAKFVSRNGAHLATDLGRLRVKWMDLCGPAVIFVGIAASPTLALAQTYIEFDVPNTGTTSYQGTVATSINGGGSITGYSLDPNNVTRAFVRLSTGDIVEFSAPNAGTDAFSGTFPWSINSGGVTTGDFEDALHVYHGF